MIPTVTEIDLLRTTEVSALVALIAARRRLDVQTAAATQNAFELSIHQGVIALGRSIVAADLACLDVDVPGLIVDGRRYYNRGKSSLTVLTLSGEVTVQHTTYRERGGHGGVSVSPLAMGVGLVDAWITPAAAKLVCKFTAAVTPNDAEELLSEAGLLFASRSTLDRIPKVVSDQWEQSRRVFEEQVRVAEAPTLPSRDDVALIGASIDGVMVRMKDALNTVGASKEDEGPKGHKEAASATISLYDKTGKRLHTVRLGRMMESKKVTLHQQLQDELAAMIDRYPTAEIAAVADAARENWRILGDIQRSLRRKFIQATDYFHAADHLGEGLNADGADPESIVRWKQKLKNEPGGADACLAELARRRSLDTPGRTEKQTEVLDKQITYFNNNARSMNYAELQARNLPIGSGVQEAACKTLVVQRMKQSGMSWLTRGGQAILTMRSLMQSGRFDLAWTALTPTFRRAFQVDGSNARLKPSWSRERLAA